MIGALRRPNILHIVTDDQSYRTITAEAMPFLASEPHGNWIKFDRALLTTPLCFPSRCSLLTGQRSDHHGRTTNNSAPPPFPEIDTAGPWMHGAGYRTALIGKYMNGYPWTLTPYVPPGWDFWRGVAYDASTYTGWTVFGDNAVEIDGVGGNYLPDTMAQWVLDFLDTTTPGQPFFCYYAPISPHNPFQPAPRHAGLTIADETPANYNEADVTDKPGYIRALPLLDATQQATADGQRKDTKRMMRAVDEGLDLIFQKLTAIGALENTIVMFHTDNGYPFGEHRRWDGLPSLPKAVPYRWCIDPQLWVRYPGARARTDSHAISSVDLTATWLSAAGAVPTVSADGASLERIICEQPITWRTVVEAYYTGSAGITRWYAALRNDGKKLVRYPPTGEYELYDWTTDPDEIASVHATDTTTKTALDTELTALIADALHWLDPSQVAPDYALPPPAGPTLTVRNKTLLSVRQGGVTRTVNQVRPGL